MLQNSIARRRLFCYGSKSNKCPPKINASKLNTTNVIKQQSTSKRYAQRLRTGLKLR